jgi:hypothetical protein
MTLVAAHPTVVGAASLHLHLAARRTSALATLRTLARQDVDRLLAKPAAERETPEWSEQFRHAHNTLWRREEHLIDAIAAERIARYQLTESQEGQRSA